MHRDGVVISEVDPKSYHYYSDRTDAFISSLADSGQQKKSGSGSYLLNGMTNGHTIDVLVLYSQSACSKMGGCLNPAPFAENLITDNNQAYINSAVNGEARIVGYKLISGYSEPTVSGSAAYTEFSHVKADMVNGSGYFSDVPNLRDDYHADVAVMFVDGTKITDGPCGVTTAMNTTLVNENYAFVVLSTGCAVGDRTLTNELGHVLSGRHDVDIGPKIGNPYRYDFGYSSALPAFHTIMGVADGLGGDCNGIDGCPRINRWSSTTQSYSGVALGQTLEIPIGNGDYYSSNMVATLANTVSIVAGYRTPSGLSVPGTPGFIQVRDCNNITHVDWWGSASGTVGWYEADLSTSSSFTNPMQVYKGPGHGFSNYFITSAYVRVHACNAAGCGPYKQKRVWATGPTCNPV